LFKFLNNDIYVKIIDKKDKKHDNEKKYIKIENKAFNMFLKNLSKQGVNDSYINSNILDFLIKSNKGTIRIIFDEINGNLIRVNSEKKIVFSENILKSLKEIKNEDIERNFLKKNKKDYIYNKDGILNKKIINYFNRFGISYSFLSSSSIKNKLANKDNDYTFLEDVFEKIFLGSFEDNIKFIEKFFQPVSVVVPSYNSEKSILEVLDAVESQELSTESKQKIEVIIVDDGSENKINDIIEEKIYSFKLQVIRLEKNSGLSIARNIGVEYSSNENLIFIDSDILLAKNYILLYSVLLSLFPNIIIFSLKKNIDIDKKFKIKIKNGLEKPDIFNDKRLVRDSGSLKWVNDNCFDDSIEVITESNYLKKMGYGRKVGVYEIQNTIVGHNFSLRKTEFYKANKFSKEFKGWGMEDAYFGAKVISNGNFLIPVMSSGVYHINHPPRSGSLEKQKKEYLKNYEIYKKLLDEIN